ncbi:MAG: hypothetical protein K2N64_02210 [Anaeroplasmataceae bacterium]|nr:hypothetical protein [Anaeroplasmataceae bacterium]
MEQQILKHIKKELCKKNKYDKMAVENIYQRAIEEYEKMKTQNSEEVWNQLKKTIDLEISNLKPKSKFLFMLIISLALFGLACIECIFLGVGLFILPEFIVVDVVLLGVLVYALLFKKNKSLWNLFILIFIVAWLGSFFSIIFSSLAMWGGYPDTKIITDFIFPCVFRYVRYAYKIYVLGKEINSSIGVYFNWIVSFILSIVFLVLYHREVRKEKKAD